MRLINDGRITELQDNTGLFGLLQVRIEYVARPTSCRRCS
jgi:hypothetical protein